MNKYAPTTGANLVVIDPTKKPRRFQTDGIGFDYRGDPRKNDFILKAVVPAKSNARSTVVVATFLGTNQDVELRLRHNQTYMVEVA